MRRYERAAWPLLLGVGVDCGRMGTGVAMGKKRAAGSAASVPAGARTPDRSRRKSLRNREKKFSPHAKRQRINCEAFVRCRTVRAELLMGRTERKDAEEALSRRCCAETADVRWWLWIAKSARSRERMLGSAYGIRTPLHRSREVV